MYIFFAGNQKYVCAELGGGINGFERPDALIANRNAPQDWETFTGELYDDKIAFKTWNGYYVTAEDGGGGPLSTTRKSVGEWELFRVIGNLIICADGHHVWSVHNDDTIDARGDASDLLFHFEDTPQSRPSINPDTLQGAFCIPTLPVRVWWPAFLGADDHEQERYIAETLKRGYNFGQPLVSGMPYRNDYPRIEPDARHLRASLEKMKAHGLITVVAFDDSRGDDLSYLRPILEPSRDLIDWGMGIYEVNGVLKDPDKVLNVLRQTRQMLPDARLAVHFTPLDEGEESYGLVDWQKAKDQANLNALFFQTAGWRVGTQEATNRIHDFTRRLMGGFHGYPILSHGVNDYENTTSRTYRYEWTESAGVQFTDSIMRAPLPPDAGFNAIKPNGFGDGGTPYLET